MSETNFVVKTEENYSLERLSMSGAPPMLGLGSYENIYRLLYV